MRNLKRLTAWLLVAALLAGSSLGALAAPEEKTFAPEETVRAVVLLESAPLTEARADAAEDRAQLFSETDYTTRLAEEKAELFSVMEDEGVAFEVVYTFDTLVNGFSCDVAYGDLDALAKLPGVKSVHVANTYAPPEPVEPGITPYMAESNAITGNDLTLDEGYTGQGMVVAVLDSGVNLTHEAFQVYGGVLGTPKLTEDAVNALIAEEALGLPEGQYYSEKIPFCYDYGCNDADPTDDNTSGSSVGHGTHVSGIAVGYAETTDSETGEKTVTFRGAAPGAQLLAMKVFGENGTTTDTYIKASEDALKLGADVINLSLTIDNGFPYDPALEGELGNVFVRLEEAGVLVCAGAGNAYSQEMKSRYLYIDPLNTDYAIVGSPSTYANNISVAAMCKFAASGDGGGGEADALASTTVKLMADFSSWGPSPDLALRPTITSIGDNVRSASYAGDDQYVSLGGTSMSTPLVAGTYASLLSFMAADEANASLTKPERAAVARQLMESTAQVVRPEEDAAPYSPRKQGAGLANSALARKAWASGWLENPLQEVGDSTEGSFTFSLTVKNNSGAAITYATSAMVLTDNSELREDGHRQNTMTAKTLFDSTGGADALGLATVTMDGEVTVAAHGEQEVPVTVTLTEAGKAYFTENGFWSGGFVEGYIFLTPTNASPDAATLHAAMLGYYGDWAQVSAADIQDFRSYLAAEYAYHTAGDAGEKTVYDFLDQPIATTVNVAYTYHSADGSLGELLGTNLMNGYDSEEESFRGTVAYAPYDPSHVLFSANSESCGYDWLYTQPSLLRNVRFIVMEVTNKATGENWADYGYAPEPTGPHNNNYVSRALLFTNDGVEHWYNFSNHHWFGKNAATGDTPADGMVFHVDLQAVMPYGADEENPYGRTQEHVWKTLTGYDEATGKPIYEKGFDFTVDSTPPEIVSTEYHAGEEGGEATLTVTVKDAHLAGVYLEENGVVVDYKLFDETTATLDDDGNWTATFSIPAEVEETEGNVVAYDYAFNKTARTAAYEEAEEPDPGESPSPSPSPSESPSPSPSTNPGGNGGSGGGGGGGGTPATPPAAATSTTTRADGAKVTTMNNSDGSTVVTVEQTDGTVSETVTAKNGEVTITVTGKDGDELAKVELPAVIPAAQTRFDDVSADHWADAAIHKMAALELVNGVGGNRYDPAASMTRASFAAVLYRLSNGSAPGHELVFADVDQNGWCADSVIWADKNGIVNGIDGVGHRLFWPNDPVTREQLAAMLCRYAKLIGIDTTADPKALEAFADGSSTGDWAADGVAWCVEKGVLKGKGQNDLDPTANVTRAEAAMMLNRFLELLK